jgi:hypothetical protein
LGRKDALDILILEYFSRQGTAGAARIRILRKITSADVAR